MVAVVLRFLALTRVVPLVLILSAIPRNLRELIPSNFSMMIFSMIDLSRYGTDCPNNRLYYYGAVNTNSFCNFMVI